VSLVHRAVAVCAEKVMPSMPPAQAAANIAAGG